MQRLRAVAAAVLLGLAPPLPGAPDEPGCAPHVEVRPRWHTIRLRVHTDAFRDCTVDERTYRRLVADWLATPAAGGSWRSLALGRAVEYPWLSSYLARAALADPDWDAARGRPDDGHANAYVAALLEREPIAARLAAPFAGSAHAVVAVSVEKVLIGPASEVGAGGGDGKVPYDAQIWLVLRAR